MLIEPTAPSRSTMIVLKMVLSASHLTSAGSPVSASIG
jgi:hypothetical protein